MANDTLDSVTFPRAGHYGIAEWRAARDDLGSSRDYDQALVSYSHVFSWRANTLIGGLVGATTLDDDAPLEGLFRLGGFLRLSGLAEQELSGQHLALARVIYTRRLSNARFVRSYFGASVELGNVWQTSSDVAFDDAISAGSVFLGVDTPIGPLYIGYGRTEEDDQSFYVSLGPRLAF